MIYHFCLLYSRVPILMDFTAKPVLCNKSYLNVFASQHNSLFLFIPDFPFVNFRYSIDRNTDLERFFNIEAASGVISTAKPLDREMNAVHNITILAIESRESCPFFIFFSFFTLKTKQTHSAGYKERSVKSTRESSSYAFLLLFSLLQRS